MNNSLKKFLSFPLFRNEKVLNLNHDFKVGVLLRSNKKDNPLNCQINFKLYLNPINVNGKII